MSVVKKEFTFPSKTGECDIYACLYQQSDKPKAVLQLHHGMAEHIERYQDFINYMCSNGIAVITHDMANHGKSNQDTNKRGYFGEKDGWMNLVADMKQVYDIGKAQFPNIPYIVFGHSMGSLITRCFIAKYGGNLDGAIICGTVGENPLACALVAITSLAGAIKGKSSYDKLFDKMAFGAYNKRFENRTAFDWLTRDTAIVDEYIKDGMCGFIFTVQGYNDLAQLLINANTKSWYNCVSKDLPITLISGEMDPCGNYGKGIEEIYKKLKDTNHDVTMKLYGKARHEILNETMKESVYQDVLNWIDNAVLKK